MSVLFIFCQQSHSSVSKTKYFVPVICQPCMMNMIFSFTFVWDKQTFYRGINHPSVIVPGGMKKFNYSASKHQASYFLWICRHHFQHGCYFQILLLLSPFLCAESAHCVKMSTLQLSFLFAVEDKVAGSQIWQAVWVSDYCVGVAKKLVTVLCAGAQWHSDEPHSSYALLNTPENIDSLTRGN